MATCLVLLAAGVVAPSVTDRLGDAPSIAPCHPRKSLRHLATLISFRLLTKAGRADEAEGKVQGHQGLGVPPSTSLGREGDLSRESGIEAAATQRRPRVLN